MDENDEAFVVYFWRVLFLMLEKNIGKRGKNVGRFFFCVKGVEEAYALGFREKNNI